MSLLPDEEIEKANAILRARLEKLEFQRLIKPVRVAIGRNSIAPFGGPAGLVRPERRTRIRGANQEETLACHRARTAALKLLLEALESR